MRAAVEERPGADRCTLLRTTDGALSWHEVNGVKGRCFGGLVFAADVSGRLLKTMSTGFPFTRAVRIVTPEVVFAKVGDELGSYLMRTVDGGMTWTRIAEGTFKLLGARSADEVLLARSIGREWAGDVAPGVGVIVHTLDGGRTWEESNTDRNLFSAVRRNSQRIDRRTDMILLENRVLALSTE